MRIFLRKWRHRLFIRFWFWVLANLLLSILYVLWIRRRLVNFIQRYDWCEIRLGAFWLLLFVLRNCSLIFCDQCIFDRYSSFLLFFGVGLGDQFSHTCCYLYWLSGGFFLRLLRLFCFSEIQYWSRSLYFLVSFIFYLHLFVLQIKRYFSITQLRDILILNLWNFFCLYRHLLITFHWG